MQRLTDEKRAWRQKLYISFSVFAVALAPACIQAAETTAYRYDALGRLIKADQTNGAANLHEDFHYDPAGNRTLHAVDGSPNGSATSAIVLPLSGSFVVIPFYRQ